MYRTLSVSYHFLLYYNLFLFIITDTKSEAKKIAEDKKFKAIAIMKHVHPIHT